MKIVKIMSVTLSLVMLCSLSSCVFLKSEENTTEAPVNSTELSSVWQPSENFSEAPSVYETEALSTAPVTTEAPTEISTVPVTEEITQPVVNDASLWDTERIASFYKTAAADTGSAVSSEQIIELSDISVNNGALGGMFSFVTPVLSKFLSSKATVTSGITGDFARLTEGDISSASAYKTDKGTAVEIKLHDQSGNASETADGSVSHAISVVGDLGSIMLQLKDAGLPIEISVDKTIISYSDATVRATVDENGKIINGTWSCVVEINMSDYSFAGAEVDSTRVVLKNIITVNGGFSV